MADTIVEKEEKKRIRREKMRKDNEKRLDRIRNITCIFYVAGAFVIFCSLVFFKATENNIWIWAFLSSVVIIIGCCIFECILAWWYLETSYDRV